MVLVVSVAQAGKGDTILVSRNASGSEGANGASYEPSLSASGRFIAYISQGSNLNGPDDLAASDIYVYDAAKHKVELVSRKSNGGPGGDADSSAPSISANGRFVAFESGAGNLVDASQGGPDIYVYDRERDKVQLVSRRGKNGPGGTGTSYNPSISANGRFVAFESQAENLSAADDPNDEWFDIYVYDRKLRKLELVSRKSNDGPGGDEDSKDASISANGRHVSFQSAAENLTGADVTVFDVFAYDRKTNRLELISRQSNNGPGADDWSQSKTGISASGRIVVFNSLAENLSGADKENSEDVFAYDRKLDRVELVSREAGNGPGGDFSSQDAAVSGSGRYVTFQSGATNLSDADVTGVSDVYAYDRKLDRVKLVSREANDGPGGDATSGTPAISAPGRFVAYASTANNLPGTYFETFQNIFRYDYLGP